MLLALVVTLALAHAQQTLPDLSPATPESQGLASERLAELGAVVQGYVDAGKIVGAELLVIRGEHVVWHRGYGWRHREEGVPMEPGGVFCLRSMTKAVVGAGVQLLIDEGRLELDDTVAQHLPAFDNERSRAIQVRHLLTHTSGLPLSSLLGTRLEGISGERDVAALAGARGPDFPPGTRYQYSDDGADTLGALIEAVSGKALEDFLRERILAPLGMRETAGVMGPGHALGARVCSHYVGGPGAWERYWSPSDAPLFSFLLGSQGLYGTALDYARFLRLFRARGSVGGRRLLSEEAVARTLAPANDARLPSGCAGLELRYGQMMMLWVDPAAPTEVVAFGHGGSEGTMAWVFPALDLSVLYFTQSRNGTTVLELGEAVQRCLLDPLTGTERARPLSYAAAELDVFTGLYWEADDQEVQAVLRRDATLFVEFPGKALHALEPTSRRDVFRFALSDAHRLEFERDGEGHVVAFTGIARGVGEHMPRLVPGADLPSLEQVLERKHKSCGENALEALGPARVSATLDMPTPGLHADVVITVDGLARCRTETDYGGQREATLVNEDGAWSWSPPAGLEELHGVRRAQAELEHPFLPAADWREVYRELAVLARVRQEDTPALLLRAVAREGKTHTWIVAEETGLPLCLLSLDEIPSLGTVGSVTRFGDWREVGGVRLPFELQVRFASVLLGSAQVRWSEVELGISPPAAEFEPGSLAPEDG